MNQGTIDRLDDDDALDRMFDEDLREVVMDVRYTESSHFPWLCVEAVVYESEVRDPVAYWALGHPVRWRRVEAVKPTPVAKRSEWRRGTFEFAGVEGGPWDGWVKEGETWNGFACPVFEQGSVDVNVRDAVLVAGIEVGWDLLEIPTNEGVRRVCRLTTVNTWNEVEP